MKIPGIISSLLAPLLRAGLLIALVATGWTIYRQLPYSTSDIELPAQSETNLQIVLRPSIVSDADSLDIAVELYPIDIVAVRHEYFTERRAGKRFEDFLSERMKGRHPVGTKLDKQGQGSINLNAGSWWLHALLSGEEELEWRLPLSVSGRNQTVELTPQNVYTRTRSF